MEKPFFPTEFTNKYKGLLGSEWESFYSCIQTRQPKSFWVNTNKASIKSVKDSLERKGVKFAQLSFHPQAFTIEHEKPSQLEEYRQGKISLQEKASMLPAVALSPTKNDRAFDACAAPGMKTIQLSNLAGEVLATEVHSRRMETLQKVKQRFALKNVELKRIDFRNIKRNKRFSKILLDAPCSSEGLIRKKADALLSWSQELVEKKAKVQKHLIVRAFDYLNKGGELVYSTCSFAPEENEEVVRHLLSQRKDAGVIPLNFEGIKLRKNELCNGCARLYPQDNDTQQFFIAKIRKE